jgi:predicted GNAT superfamily acetyltransferase
VAGSQAEAAEITISSLTTEDQFREAVQLQRIIWGFEDLDLLPFRFFVVAVKVGGQLFGAFDGGKMVAFCLAIPGLKPGAKPYLHSHMLGVLDGYRDLGLGRRMKLHQRDDALARGIDLIEWTFDPLELKNAWFNIERLGAVVRRYVRNQYGMSSSHLQSGLPTDRCTAEWWLAKPRPHGPVAERISYPADISAIRRSDPQRAREIQATNADLFEEAFRRNLVVTGVERTPGVTSYLLSELAE